MQNRASEGKDHKLAGARAWPAQTNKEGAARHTHAPPQLQGATGRRTQENAGRLSEGERKPGRVSYHSQGAGQDDTHSKNSEGSKEWGSIEAIRDSLVLPFLLSATLLHLSFYVGDLAQSLSIKTHLFPC